MAVSVRLAAAALLAPVLALLAARWLQPRGGRGGPPPPDLPSKACAGQFQLCNEVGCCNTSGFTCYQKNPAIAVCMNTNTCKVGVHEGDPPGQRTPWTCKPHQCGEPYQGCTESGCCRTKGFSCYKKDQWYAACLPSCQPGVNKNDPPQFQTPWSCEKKSVGEGKSNMPINKGAVECRDQTPDTPGEPSELFDFDWWRSNASCKVSPEDVAAYDRDGYVVLRQVLEMEPLEALRKRAKELCSKQLQDRGVCQIEQVRWQVNIFRDFMLYSSLGCLMHNFVRGAGVRIQSEGLFGLQYNEVDPQFFSYSFHVDNSFKGHGVLHGFPTGTKAASVWFPFHDLDPDETGGSIGVVKGYPHTECKFSACGGMVVPSKSGPKLRGEDCFWKCVHENACSPQGCHNFTRDSGMIVPSFRKGDVVIWHSDMPHRTQRVAMKGFERYSFTIRFIESDAELCNPGIACGGPLGCCKALPKEAGRKVHSPCYPQIYPKVLDHEVAAHYSSEPKILIGDKEHERSMYVVPPTPECSGPP